MARKTPINKNQLSRPSLSIQNPVAKCNGCVGKLRFGTEISHTFCEQHKFVNLHDFVYAFLYYKEKYKQNHKFTNLCWLRKLNV